MRMPIVVVSRNKRSLSAGAFFCSQSTVMSRPGRFLFHLHGRGENVEGSGGERAVDEVAVNLRAHVVDVGFDHGDEFGRSVSGGLADGGQPFADEEAQHVRLLLLSAVPAP